ncbi:MAG: MFS transporter [Microbacteriaceae bacterium]
MTSAELTQTRWGALHGVAVARALSMFGTVVIIWALIFRERAEGPVAISAMFIAAGLPYILFGPWAGWLADRFSTRQLIPAVSIIQAALTLVFIIDMPLWLVLIAIFGYNAIAAVESPAWQALQPKLTTPADMTRSYGIMQGYFAAAQVGAPVAAGILVGTTGYVWPFIIDAATFAILAITPFILRVNRPGHQAHEDHKESTVVGYRHLWTDRLLRSVTVLLGAFIITIGVVNTGEIFLVMDILGANETTYGIIAALFSVGNLVGAAVLGARAIGPNWQPRALVLSLWVVGTGILAIAISPSLWFVGIANAVTGLAHASLHATANTMLQNRTPDSIRGRVNAAFTGFMTFGNLIATAFAGVALGVFGIREVMIAGSVLALVALVVLQRSVWRADAESVEETTRD